MVEEEKNETKEDKKKRKKRLWLALVDLGKSLKGACGQFENVSQWYDFLKGKLEPIINEFRPEIGEEKTKRLNEFFKLGDESKEGVKKACELLRGDLTKLVKYHAPKNVLGQVLNGAFGAGAVALIGGLVYLNLNPAAVVIKNQGCEPIKTPLTLLINLPALNLPQGPIANGEQATAKLPPVKFSVDASQKGTVRLKAFNLTFDFKLEGESIDILYNNGSLLTGVTTVDLSQKGPHQITAVCRP